MKSFKLFTCCLIFFSQILYSCQTVSNKVNTVPPFVAGITTDLHKAAADGNLIVVKQLVESGFDINVRDEEGWTPLMLATAKESAEVVSYLLETGADPNLLEADRNSAIMMAAMSCNGKIIEALLSNNANCNTQNSKGLTPYMVLYGFMKSNPEQDYKLTIQRHNLVKPFAEKLISTAISQCSSLECLKLISPVLFENWSDSGETYEYYCVTNELLDLCKIKHTTSFKRVGGEAHSSYEFYDLRKVDSVDDSGKMYGRDMTKTEYKTKNYATRLGSKQSHLQSMFLKKAVALCQAK